MRCWSPGAIKRNRRDCGDRFRQASRPEIRTEKPAAKMVVHRITAWADTPYANAAAAINENMASPGANEACNELLGELPE